MKAILAILFFALVNINLAGVNDGIKVPTGHIVRPAGKTLSFSSRPIDLVLSPDGAIVFVKTHTSLLIADAEKWKVIQDLPYNKDEHASMHGIAVSGDGKTVYLTNSGNDILEAIKDNNGKWVWKRRITLKSKDEEDCFPCGIALSKDGLHAYVAISRNNSVGIVNLKDGIMTEEIATGVAPYDVVLSPDENSLYISNWGGRLVKDGDNTMMSSGTPVVVDEREIPVSGTVMKIDLETSSVISETETGLHPSDMVLSRDGLVLYTANANSDNISIIETKDMHVSETINLRPEKSLTFGSITNALAISEDELTLYAANGGNNAVAVISLNKKINGSSKVNGFIPAGWFPSALAVNRKNIFIANAKGDGIKGTNTTEKNKFFVKWHRGTVNKVNVPSPEVLVNYTKQVIKDALIPQVLKAFEKNGRAGVKPVPIPKNPGEPSVFNHVIYVIKENRTYDQLFGDLTQANSDPKLCIYGRVVTPNHHALAEQFALLDNYYCPVFLTPIRENLCTCMVSDPSLVHSGGSVFCSCDL